MSEQGEDGADGEAAGAEAGAPAALERALALLGRLEARIMQLVWTGGVSAPFTVHEVHAGMPELAYTTVLSTMRRLVEKGLLAAEAAVGRRAHHYRPGGDPATFLAEQGDREAAAVIARYGDAALAAFAQRWQALSPEQREALSRVRGRA
jgi:predicted transcriptional regulator